MDFGSNRLHGNSLNAIDSSRNLKATTSERDKNVYSESQMRIRYASFIVALVVLCFGPIAVTEVAAVQRPVLNPIGNPPREYFVDAPYGAFYDARDFSGI